MKLRKDNAKDKYHSKTVVLHSHLAMQGVISMCTSIGCFGGIQSVDNIQPPKSLWNFQWMSHHPT